MHTSLPEQMPFQNFSFFQCFASAIVMIGRKDITMITEPILLQDIAIEIVIEPVDFLFIGFLIKPMGVPATVDLVDQVPLLLHQGVVVLIKYDGVDGAVFGGEVMLLAVLLWVEGGVAFYGVVEMALLGVVH